MEVKMTNENKKWDETRDLVDKVTQNIKEGKKDEAKTLIGAIAKSENLGYFTVHLLKRIGENRSATRKGYEAGTPRDIAKEMYEMMAQALEQAGRTEDAQIYRNGSTYL
jgi:hypothetical protein